jgi:hypothetical protein
MRFSPIFFEHTIKKYFHIPEPIFSLQSSQTLKHIRTEKWELMNVRVLNQENTMLFNMKTIFFIPGQKINTQ